MSHHPFSPSRLQSFELCPGKFLQELTLPEPPASEDATLGSKIHAAIAKKISTGEYANDCTPEILEVAEECWNFLSTVRPAEDVPILPEVKLRYAEEEELFFGTADVFFKQGNHGYIIDWKTGHNPVPVSKDNLQGAAYALAAMQEYSVTDCTVIFHNPILRQTSSHVFTQPEKIAEYIKEIISNAKDPNAELRPGEDQCRYCKANSAGSCPALREKMELLAMRSEVMSALGTFDVYTDDNLVSFIDGCNLIKKMHDAAEDEIKKRCRENGRCGSGVVGIYTLTITKGSREVTDIPSAFSALNGVVSQQDFLDACKVSLPKLEAAFYTSAKSKDKTVTKSAARAEMEKLIDAYVKIGEPKERLKKVNESSNSGE